MIMARRKKKNQAKILIVGHGRHGKDTLAELITKHQGNKFRGSSAVMCEELYSPHFEALYDSPEALFEARHEHRNQLYDLICDYNKEDPTRLARKVMEGGHGYTGMRAFEEVMECIKQDVFTHVIWIERNDIPKADPTQGFSFEDLYEEVLREDTSFSLAKVKNYSVDWLDKVASSEKMRKFLELSDSFVMFA